MKGFKSFANKTELLFGERFNCILGPNGSGKSNILDALVFVLGKSGAKGLRAEKTANLIYNGGKTKQPAKDGEVVIWFDNAKEEFGKGFAELKFARTVKDDGTSVYRINDKKFSRAEVVELLELQLKDTIKGRVLGPEGSVLRRGLDPTGPPLRSQYRSYEHGLLTSGVRAVTQKLSDYRDGDI